MDLIIVESPTKAKTLKRFLGDAYSVEATMGHIKDLPKSELGVDLENNFAPTFLAVDKKKPTISKIKALAKKAKSIFVATDPDREGEAIASHVVEILADAKLGKGIVVSRISFHEITKEAVSHALQTPGKVDSNLVDAQTARRVLDRLVGYKLSPLLWKKVRVGLSAGRVQTVLVRLIVEREREIKAFKPQEYWEIFSVTKKKAGEKLDITSQLIQIDGKKAVVSDGKTAKELEEILNGSVYKVVSVKGRQVNKSPYPPFTTSTLAQAGARMFGWSSKRTMMVAQKLYEEGYITYHRTDSVNIASEALSKVRALIGKEFGEKYLPQTPRYYKNKSKVAQEAHEAIRPTMGETPRFADNDQEKLFTLIKKRFVASQMSPAIYDETSVEIEATKDSRKLTLRTSGQIMRFDGWRALFPGRSEEDVVQIPELKEGEELDLVKVVTTQKFTEPPPRYNEASIIKTLEKLGIGRPSTYAPTITTVQVRGYTEKEDGKFFATAVGEAVSDFLIGNFSDIFEYSFTALMESELDKIANGKLAWVKAIKEFWDPLAGKLKGVEKTAERVKIQTEATGRECPECKKGELVVRTGRFGKFISCSTFPECKYTEKLVTKINMKCPDCGEGEVIVKTTKRKRKFFGCSRYPACKWASWKKPVADGSSK